VAGAADSASGEHHGAEGMLGDYGKDLDGGRWDFGHYTLCSCCLSVEALIDSKVDTRVR
jgi:hypothetical protein